MSILDELFSVTGKGAVVTGGAKGVGSMISRALVRAGADVLVVGRGAEAGAAFVNGLEGPGKAAFLTHDLGTKEGVEAAARDISGRASAVHILINNAGIFTAGNVEDVKADQWDRELGLNLRAPFFLVQALLPKLKAASRSEEHTSELQSLMRISYAVFCLKTKKI